MATYCDQCDHVVKESRKWAPHRWLCSKFPQLEGQGFVAPNWWVENEPFNRCVNINKGQCPLWSPLRNGQLDSGI